MKLQVERDPLAEAVAWTARALPARPTAPVLAGMRLQAGNELTLSTFDYEVSAQSTIPVQADEPGTVLVSGRLLAEIVRSLPAKPVDLTTDGTRTTLKCGSATFTLLLLPAEEYPTLPTMPDTTGTVGADAFASAIHQVAIAAPGRHAARADRHQDGVQRGHADAGRHRPVPAGDPRAALDAGRARPEHRVLVPARVLGDTARQMTGGAEVSVALSTTEGASDGIIGFEGGGRRTTTRLLSGEYPRYQTLLPSEFSAVAELPAMAFADAVKRVALVAERNTPVRLTFASSEVLLEAGTGDEAQASEAISASFDGEEMQIAFNPQYLLDGINAVDSDTVRISFTTATRPAVITGKGEAQPDYRYVIMPIRSAG